MSKAEIKKIENPNNADHYAHLRVTDRHIQVRYKNTLLAETKKPLALTENGKFLYDTVYYIPKEDLIARMEEHEGKSTRCPIKGEAFYWNWNEVKDIAWSYEEPLEQSQILHDYVGFDLSKADLLILAH